MTPAHMQMSVTGQGTPKCAGCIKVNAVTNSDTIGNRKPEELTALASPEQHLLILAHGHGSNSQGYPR